jgi:3-hydroxybutyryl-CoA dehydrogenase
MATPDIASPALTLGVIGAGTMGRGIAQVAAEGGVAVRLFDANSGAAEAGRAFIVRMVERQAEKGAITTEAARAIAERVTVEAELAAAAGCDVVIEAVVEDLEVKRKLFAAIEAAARPDTIIATNTSSLSVTAIAAACERRERIAGMHFFNPVPLMKLVEVIPGLATSPEVTAALVALARRMGREPAVSVDSPGFIVNHVGRAYVPEAGRIVAERVAAFHEVDRIMTGAPGFRLGPFALLDLIGSDISVAAMESIWAQFFGEPMYATGPELKLRVTGGLYGMKNGLGWYAYENGKRIEPPGRPAATSRPKLVWVMPSEIDPHITVDLTQYIAAQGIAVDRSAVPLSEALIVVTPIGRDLTSTVFDMGLDPARCVAVDMLFGLAGPRTVMVTPATDPAYARAALGLMTADGTAAVLINDSPGFVAQRIVAHIINVACQVASRGVASPADIDMGTRLGLGYPTGPLAWGDKLGAGVVLHILERLEDFYRDPRYRPSPWLKRRAMLGLSLLAPNGTERDT